MTSPSTLIRKAAKTKNKTTAQRLRAEAARMRREARQPPAKPSDDIVDRVFALAAAPDIPAHFYRHEGAEWHEVPAAINGIEIEQLRKEARKGTTPKNVDSFAIMLRAKVIDAKVSARKEVEDANTERFKTIAEVNRINVVSAFIAEMYGIAKLNGGSLPSSVVVSGFTVARVLDALRDAGYTKEGKEGMKRRT